MAERACYIHQKNSSASLSLCHHCLTFGSLSHSGSWRAATFLPPHCGRWRVSGILLHIKSANKLSPLLRSMHSQERKPPLQKNNNKSIWNRKCQKRLFHRVLLCRISKTLSKAQKKKAPSWLHRLWCRNSAPASHRTSHWADGGRRMLKAVKKTWSGRLQVGISRCRGCTPICTCNLHQSAGQPNKSLKGVRGVAAFGLMSCRAAWQGSVAGAAVVYQDVSCELLVVSEGRLASGWGGGQLTQGLFV